MTMRLRVVFVSMAIAAGLALAGAGACGDGIMLVSAGAFWMGRDDGPADERPLHRVYVTDFWLEREKVTNAELAEFLDAQGIVSPERERRFDEHDAGARIHQDGRSGRRRLVVRRARLLSLERAATADRGRVGEDGPGRLRRRRTGRRAAGVDVHDPQAVPLPPR